jgi:hypothetical protein
LEKKERAELKAGALDHSATSATAFFQKKGWRKKVFAKRKQSK